MQPQAYVERDFLFFHKVPTYAKSKHWPNVFVHIYLATMIVATFGSFATLIGAVPFSVRVFLNLFGVVIPSVSVFGFVVALSVSEGTRLYPTTAVQVWTWVFSASFSTLWVGSACLVHIYYHGNRNTFQPLADFTDTGTTYFFCYMAAFSTGVCNLFLTLGVVYGYCQNLYFPSKITFSTPSEWKNGGSILKVKEP